MVILLNIGNTHTQIAEAVDGKIIQTRKVMTSDLKTEMFSSDIPIAAATVVPEAKSCLKELDIFWVEKGCKCDIELDQVDSSTLGADRIANLIALGDRNQLPSLCIDCGTAITFELLDENKIFLGGAIAPGRAMMRNSMHDYAAQLPFVPLSIDASKEPGKATVEQMLLGIDVGAVGAVKELIKIMRRRVEGKLNIIVVGGDADFFVRNISDLKYGGDDFTLLGILKAWEMNIKCK
jgi:type III pantothenate kinase